MKIFFKAIFIFILLVFVFNACWAAEEKPKYPYGVEFLTGFGIAKLHQKPAYHVVPLFVDFDFDLKPLTQKIGIAPAGLLQFVLEPFVAGVFQPDNNLEAGNNFVIKVGILPESAKFQPYFKGGMGLLYMSQHTREQATQFNFNEYAGGGYTLLF